MRNGIFTYQFICLISGTILLAGTANVVEADEDRIPVGTVNGETIWLDDVMRQVERLPAEYRQAPMENYFDQLVTDMVDSKIAADAARAAKYDKREEIASAMKTAAASQRQACVGKPGRRKQGQRGLGGRAWCGCKNKMAGGACAAPRECA